MEHKQHDKAVHKAHFRVEIVPMGPDVDEERVFLSTETERAYGELQRLEAKGWIKQALARTAGPSADQFRHYLHQLDTYERVLDRFELKVAEGRVPFRVIVTNIDGQVHKDIQINVRIHDGEFLLTEQLPTRPDRPDGSYQHYTPESTPALASLPILSKFERTKTAIHAEYLAARFSQLEAGEDAALINQTLVIALEPKTDVRYTVRSGQAAPEHGHVEL